MRLIITIKIQASYDNNVRSENGIPLRSYYGQDASGTWTGSLLNNYGKHRESKYFPNYFYGGTTAPVVNPSTSLAIPIVIPNITPQVFNP
ncbi:hypothetical protein K0U91_09015 [Chryseobacterium chendengshani]|uniref:hypothetical protein n=1 Tax=Chryseobacterium sp. LJ668 TaxID=2864040 RepID=UPI001C691EA4|nr:hypothetical protein [Chryseobacterium sp. LJ668]MBW8524760.1 hypothetical protein [Chryseobacterium sp. LJ668]QYK15219.1 hypothetical protein K0U91_09015 [Chryseobacterium sp. LJ668]